MRIYSETAPSLERNAVAVDNLKVDEKDQAQGVATALKGLQEMVSQGAEVAETDKLGLQISPRGTEAPADAKLKELLQPKQYQPWQILPGKMKSPPNANLKLFQQQFQKKMHRLQGNMPIAIRHQ